MEGRRQDRARRHGSLCWWIVLVVGLAMQLWLWTRAVWIYGDQLELYSLGLALARDGRLLAFGKLSTGDYFIPGVLLELLVGLPLLAWLDYRSPTLVLVALHLAAALLLSRTLSRDFGWRLATIYLVIFWLSPWRLYHSGFLWETNYLLLPAALHLWSARALSQRAAAWPSAVLAGTLVLSAQLHGSFVILLLAALFLAFRRRIHLHAGGALVGAGLAAVALIPTLLALLTNGEAPPRPAAPADLLTRLNSLQKAFFYWFRLGSLDVGRRFRQSLFCHAPGGGDASPDPGLCHLVQVTEVLALASVAVSLAAGWWLLREASASPAERDRRSPGRWHRDYALATFVAVLVSALFCPVLLQGWHVLIALPAACLAPALWIDGRWPRAGAWLRAVMLLFVLWRIPASLLFAGHPMYARPATPELPRNLVPGELLPLLPEVRRDRRERPRQSALPRRSRGEPGSTRGGSGTPG